jgi:hypothetical protein
MRRRMVRLACCRRVVCVVASCRGVVGWVGESTAVVMAFSIRLLIVWGWCLRCPGRQGVADGFLPLGGW